MNYLNLPTGLEMQKIDQQSIAKVLTGIELMSRAGKQCFLEIKKYLQPAKPSLTGSKIIIFCGSGNNGGDGLTIALEMVAENIKPQVVVIDSKQYSPEFEIQFTQLKNTSLDIHLFSQEGSHNNFSITLINSNDLESMISEADLLIDCLLGTGQYSAPRGAVKDLLKFLKLRKDKSKLIAIDIPTGLAADSGQLLSEDAVSADLTICIEMIKRGLLQEPARAYVGNILVVDINLLPGKVDYCLTAPDLEFCFTRVSDGHKGCYGHVFVLAGSAEYPGAAWLASLAAYKAGAGLVSKIQFEADHSNYLAEVIKFPLKGATHLDSLSLEKILDQSKKVDVLLVGPGIGQDQTTSDFLFQLLKSSKLPKVLDADALNLIAQFSETQLAEIDFTNSIFTPHPAEAARLLKVDTEKIQSDRFQAVEELASKYQATVVLKGAGTLVYGDNHGYLNPYGNPLMATAGSGDVLAGVIAALIGQKFGILDAARYAAAIHGIAGNYAARNASGPILASEICEHLGQAISFLESYRSNLDFDSYLREINMVPGT